jgi:hypothetical protein
MQTGFKTGQLTLKWKYTSRFEKGDAETGLYKTVHAMPLDSMEEKP